jgi:hypothetical protein
MSEQSLVWLTDGHGVLTADASGYSVTVERLLPAADARFVVWAIEPPRGPLVSGIRPSPREAMQAAEQSAARLCFRARATAAPNAAIGGAALPDVFA